MFFFDKRIRELLKRTNGYLLYQEQVIDILMDVGKLNLQDADKMRGFMKKQSRNLDYDIPEFNLVKHKFIKGAKQNKYSAEKAEEILESLKREISVLYIKSHVDAIEKFTNTKTIGD